MVVGNFFLKVGTQDENGSVTVLWLEPCAKRSIVGTCNNGAGGEVDLLGTKNVLSTQLQLIHRKKPCPRIPLQIKGERGALELTLVPKIDFQIGLLAAVIK